MKAYDRYPALMREGDMKSRPQDFDCFFPYLKRHHSDLQSVCPVSWHRAPHCCCHSSLPPSVNMALSPQQPVNGPYVWRALLQESGLKNICPRRLISVPPQSTTTAPMQTFGPTRSPESVSTIEQRGSNGSVIINIFPNAALFVFTTRCSECQLQGKEIWQQKWILAMTLTILDEKKNIGHFSALIPVFVCQSGTEGTDCLVWLPGWFWATASFCNLVDSFDPEQQLGQEEVPWLTVHFAQITKENISCLSWVKVSNEAFVSKRSPRLLTLCLSCLDSWLEAELKKTKQQTNKKTTQKHLLIKTSNDCS